MKFNDQNKYYRISIFVLCSLPFFITIYHAASNQLDVNPSETMIRRMGDWALYFLIATLSLSPIKDYLGLSFVIKYRRMIGLFSFFYASLHVLLFVWLEHLFNLSEIVADVFKRPFITIGFICFCVLTVLAATSTDKMKRRLKKKWKTLHKAIYIASLLCILHYFMMIKADYKQPLIFLFVILALLLLRLKPLITKYKNA